MKKHITAVVTTLFLTLGLKGVEERTTFTTLYDGRSHGRIEAFVAEKDGTGWAKTYKDLLYFKDGKLQRLKGTPVEGCTFVHALLGDAENGYYSPHGDSEKKQKLIYRLIDGEARLHCSPLSVDSNSKEFTSNTYVAQDGRVLSWNANRIALWQNGVWSMKAVSMTSEFKLPIVFEQEGSLVLVCEHQMHVIDPIGKLSTLQMEWKQPTSRCVRWKGRTAIRISRFAKTVESFDLLNGQAIALPEALKTLPGPMTDLAVVSSGHILIKTCNAIFALASDGTLSCPSATMPELFDAMSDLHNCLDFTDLTQDGRNGLWFSSTDPGLYHFSAQGLELWDWRHGLRGGVKSICCASPKVIHFLSENRQGKIVQARLGELPPAEIAGIRADRWSTYRKRRGTGLYEADGIITYLPAATNTVRRWNGSAFSEQQLPSELGSDHALMLSDDRGCLYVQMGRQPSKPYGLKAAITPEGIHVFSRPSQTTSFFQMEEALEWGVSKGATGFECQNMHFLVTPEKHIYWCCPHISEAIRYFNGAAWSTLRPARSPAGFAYSPRYGALVRISAGGFLRYQTGLLEPLNFDTGLLMQDGLLRCPFDRMLMSAEPDRYMLIAPQSLPAAGGRSSVRDSARFTQFFMLPGLTPSRLGINADEAKEKSLLKFQQYQDIKAYYPSSGGCFLRKRDDPPIRVFGGVKIPLILENTALFDRLLGNIHEDINGNIWFDSHENGRVVCCYRSDDLRVAVHAEPVENAKDRLIVHARVEPPVKNVHFFYRLSEREAWQPFSGETTETLYFTESGSYTCEVSAVHMSARLKHIGSLRHEAHVALPETSLLEPSDFENVITVKTPDWHPPVVCVPVTSEMRDACTLMWRRDELYEPWQPLGADGRFPFNRLGTNGLYRLLFATLEEGFRRDVTPECLTVRLDLSDEEQLVLLIENLTGTDFVARDAAYIQLNSDRPKWLAVLHKLETQSSAARDLLNTLGPVQNLLKAD